ncbi:hypothetical protein [Halarcobacter sp.]|uniref:hypothetical protein n=1 Tax=Halarcobacter sp. TaxID=2321133 RepID=UPI0029F51378|nr:hypothetical protein [Halarcobacter sp.]
MQNFEKGVIQALKDANINTQKYFGEFANPQQVNIDLNKVPIVFVDYTGSTPEGRLKENHEFYLYIAHLSYSNNETNRSNKHYELYDLFKNIKTALNLKSFDDSEPITWGKKQKIFDAVTQKGYLTVFTQVFTAEI